MPPRSSDHDDGHGPIEHLLLHDHAWAWRVSLGLWVVAGLLFVAMAISPLRSAIESFDRAIYDATYPVKWAPLTAVARTLAFVGSAVFVWPLRLVVAIWLAVRRRWPAFWVWVLAIALSEPFIGLLKAAYDRSRPAVSLVVETTGAFPSGHAVAGAVVAVSLVIVFVPAGPARRNLELAAVAFALVMAGSRLYLGAHWFTDVAAGLAFGTACAVGAAAVVQRVVHARAGSSPPTAGSPSPGNPSDPGTSSSVS